MTASPSLTSASVACTRSRPWSMTSSTGSWTTRGSTPTPRWTRHITACRGPGSSIWSPRWCAGPPGGPQRYNGRTMRDSHAHLAITEGEWQVFLNDLHATFAKFSVPPTEQAELLAIVASTKQDIVGPPVAAD